MPHSATATASSPQAAPGLFPTSGRRSLVQGGTFRPEGRLHLGTIVSGSPSYRIMRALTRPSCVVALAQVSRRTARGSGLLTTCGRVLGLSVRYEGCHEPR